MKQCISVGWGSNLHLLSSAFGPRTMSRTTTDRQAGDFDDVRNEFAATTIPGSFSDYYDSLYGGPLTSLPGAYNNHKPGAFYFGQFYYSAYVASVNNSRCYILRFDGSGIFRNATGDNGVSFENDSHSGKGIDFISPSGNGDLATHSLCCVPHNGNIFFVGAAKIWTHNPITSPWTAKEDWNVGPDRGLTTGGGDAGFGLPRRRAYMSLAVTKRDQTSKEGRHWGNLSVLHNRTTPSGLAPDYESLHGCDAISWKDGIIFANSVDIIEFPGGSGFPRAIEIGTLPSAKSLEPHPSGGFDQSTGSSIGQIQLLILESSGVIKKINQQGEPEYNSNGKPFGAELFENVQGPASGAPFGTTTLVNLGSLVSDFTGPKVRTLGSRARMESLTAQPDRSCFLKTFDKRLHAFFISASSGYYHFTCEGDPRNIDNWTDRTTDVPNAVKLNDGCLFGYRDDNFSTINLMHVAKSDIGWAGLEGGNKGNGGWAVYSIGSDLSWKKRYFGAANTDTIGLIPYNPQGVFAQVPSGAIAGPAPGNPQIIASTDYALMQYSLFTGRAPNIFIDVNVEYTINDGSSWNEATQFRDYVTGSGLGEGKTNLEASPFGSTHQFLWHHVQDVGFNLNKGARLRVTPRLRN